MPRATKRKPPTKPPRAKSRRPSYRHGNLREALIAEAIRLMEERADASFTLREAAQHIRVSHTAAYRHFPNKGALLAEMARRGFAILAEGLATALAEAKSADDAIARQARAYVRTALEHRAFFRCMFGPRQFGAAENEAVDASCDACFTLLTRAATRLGEEHRIAASAIPDLSLAIWSMTHGLTSLVLDGQLCETDDVGPTKTYERMAETAIRQLLSGLIPRKA